MLVAGVGVAVIVGEDRRDGREGRRKLLVEVAAD